MQQEDMSSGASSSLSAVSPSFTSYSSKNLADIAARVVHELNLPHDGPYDDFFYSSPHQNDAVKADNVEKNDVDDVEDDEESEFEFAVLCGEDTSSPISADDIFYNGQIMPIYPLFNTDLVYGYQNDAVSEDGSKTMSEDGNMTPLRLPSRKVMREEIERRNDSVSSSSLEGVPQGTYCVWAPKKKSNVEQENTVALKKKSNSTGSGVGSSKQWRLRDLVHRSNSEGKDSFVFLTPSQYHHHNHINGGEIKRREKVTAVNSHGKKMEEKKKKNKSYLPYRPELVGFFW